MSDNNERQKLLDYIDNKNSTVGPEEFNKVCTTILNFFDSLPRDDETLFDIQEEIQACIDEWAGEDRKVILNGIHFHTITVRWAPDSRIIIYQH